MKKSFIKTLIFSTTLLAACFLLSTEAGVAASQDLTKVLHSETEGKAYKVRAMVKKIFREEKKITLAHEKIRGVMTAMTTVFPVSRPSIFDSVKVGSRRTFILLLYKGIPTVVGLTPIRRKR